MNDHGHSHSHTDSHQFAGKAPRAILIAIGITLVFMVVEFIGGYFANSLALVSDGAHMFTDVGAMLLSLFAVWISNRPSTRSMSFGYHRAEILGALLSGLAIWLIAGILIIEAVGRIQAPPPVRGPIVFVIATLGLIANITCMRALHGAKSENMNARAAYLHALSDSLGSIGAIVAGIILIFTHWSPIDPIVTILFAILMLFSSWGLIKEAVEILMESTPANIDSNLVYEKLHALDGVREAHDLHIWTVSSGRLALSVHLISDRKDPEVLLTLANELLQKEYGIIHTTIQVEHPDHFQSERCYDCHAHSVEVHPGQ